MLTVFQKARKAIEEVLKTCKVKQANERAIKKSALCTTYTIDDGEGESEGFSTCAEKWTWQPVITIYFHNYTDRARLHKEVAEVKNDVIMELIAKGRAGVEGLLDFGSPISWNFEQENEIMILRITLTCVGIE